MTIGVVMNPAAGGGKLAAMWPEVARALERQVGPFEVRRTARPGEAAELARAFAEQGAELVVAAGGDGTAGEVADGILRASRRPQLGLLPIGTGKDFVRNLDLGRTMLDAVAVLASGRTRTIDAGRVTYVADDGSAGEKHFVNIASLGLSGPTDRAVNAVKQGGRWSGRAVFLYHTVVQLLRYRLQDVRVVLDGAETIDARIAVVAVANGRFFGGGMMVAPDAELDDGLFDVVVFRGASKLELIANLRLLYSGAHKGHRLVTIKRARVVEVMPHGDAALIDIDGESPGRIPARFEILPGALTLRA